MSVSVDARDLSKLHNDLKRAGSALRPELRRGVLDAIRPVAAEVRRQALLVPTKHGVGLDKAAKNVRTFQRYGSQGAVVGVQVRRAGAKYAAPGASFRHPVFGNRQVWVTQRAEHEFFDRAVTYASSGVERRIAHVMDDILRKADL